MQARSLQKRNDLLKAGRNLLHDRVLESISIKDICAEAHCTVGSFYSRFEDKESYFDALIAESCQEMLAQAAERFGSDRLQGASAKQISQEVVLFLLDIFQGEYSSILTESFLREAKGFVAATPMRDVGHRFIQTISPHVLPHIDREINPDPLRALAFGVQMMYGMLHNAKLRDPGPIRFRTDEFNERLCALFQRYLGIR